jgi:hypothetical protein
VIVVCLWLERNKSVYNATDFDIRHKVDACLLPLQWVAEIGKADRRANGMTHACAVGRLGDGLFNRRKRAVDIAARFFRGGIYSGMGISGRWRWRPGGLMEWARRLASITPTVAFTQ